MAGARPANYLKAMPLAISSLLSLGSIRTQVRTNERGTSLLAALTDFSSSRSTLLALLTFDSFKQLAPAGTRSGKASSRQLTFEAPDVEVGVLLRRSDDRTVSVSGQVLDKASGPITDPAAQVDLVVDGDHLMSSSLSPWGEFVFSAVPNGPYGLQIYLLDQMVEIPLPSIDE